MTRILSSNLPSLITTVVGTVLGFWGAYLIYFFTTKRQRREKGEFEKNRWEYFQYLLKNSIERTKMNIKLLGKKIEEIARNKFEIPPIEQKTNGDFRRLLHDIDLEGVFHLYKKIFSEDYPKEIFYAVISKFDYFELKLDLLKAVFENAMRNDFARRVNFNDSFIRAANKIDDIKEIFFRSEKKTEYLLVDKIAREYKMKEEKNRASYEYHYKKLLFPIHKILRDNILGNSKLQEINFDFESAIFKYNLIIKGNSDFQSEIEEDKKQLAGELEKLEELIEPILKSNIEKK